MAIDLSTEWVLSTLPPTSSPTRTTARLVVTGARNVPSATKLHDAGMISNRIFEVEDVSATPAVSILQLVNTQEARLSVSLTVHLERSSNPFWSVGNSLPVLTTHRYHESLGKCAMMNASENALITQHPAKTQTHVTTSLLHNR